MKNGGVTAARKLHFRFGDETDLFSRNFLLYNNLNNLTSKMMDGEANGGATLLPSTKVQVCCVNCGQLIITSKEKLEGLKKPRDILTKFYCEACKNKARKARKEAMRRELLSEQEEEGEDGDGDDDDDNDNDNDRDDDDDGGGNYEEVGKKKYKIKRNNRKCDDKIRLKRNGKKIKLKDKKEKPRKVRKCKDKLLSCRYCPEIFSKSEEKASHEKTLHANQGVKYMCDKCDYSTYTKGVFTTHLKRHIKQYNLFCVECNVGFYNNTELTAHNIKSHGSEPFQCATCNDIFTSKGNLYSHIRSHDPNNSYVCEICGRTYKKKNSYKRHISRSHMGLNTKAQCPICQKVLSTKEHLRRHLIIHNNVRNWVCSICGKSFVSKTYLTEHSRIHLGIRPYKCDICEKCFTQRGSLTIHKRSHTGERPFKCTFCDKAFIMSTLLRYHLKKCGAAHASYAESVSLLPMTRITAASTPTNNGASGGCGSSIMGGGNAWHQPWDKIGQQMQHHFDQQMHQLGHHQMQQHFEQQLAGVVQQQQLQNS